MKGESRKLRRKRFEQEELYKMLRNEKENIGKEKSDKGDKEKDPVKKNWMKGERRKVKDENIG